LFLFLNLGAIIFNWKVNNFNYFYCFSCVDTVIGSGERAAISTGLKMKPPRSCYIRVAARSGMVYKNGVSVGGGVIDRDYTGVIFVLMFNLGKSPLHIKVGDRIGQAIVERYRKCSLLEVESLPNTERGASGLGSSGI